MKLLSGIGQQVHYVLADKQHRSATIVNSWPDSAKSGIVNLSILLDPANDLQSQRVIADTYSIPNPYAGQCKPQLIPAGAGAVVPGSLAASSAHHDEDTKAPGTWHYAETLHSADTDSTRVVEDTTVADYDKQDRNGR